LTAQIENYRKLFRRYNVYDYRHSPEGNTRGISLAALADAAMSTSFPDEMILDGYEEGGVALQGEKCSSPEERTFDDIFARYQSMVFNLTFRILGDREEALDVSQEVFFSVFRKLHRFRGESSLKTWIYRIAVNRASNRCRWWNRLRRRGTVSLDEHLGGDDARTMSETLVSGGKNPEESLLQRETRHEIERTLRRLPVQQRVAVIMRDVEGMSYEEIAGLLEFSVGTVKSRIARGRDQLKRRLNGSLG
jgi:RNA polymerase sigma-70 factor (ECF subfamily)